MIYSGHVTMRHVSRLQYPPEVTSQILEAVNSGFADLIFVYRHPLDSLLTNWVWWRTKLRDGRMIRGIRRSMRTRTNCVPIWSKTSLNSKRSPKAMPSFSRQHRALHFFLSRSLSRKPSCFCNSLRSRFDSRTSASIPSRSSLRSFK